MVMRKKRKTQSKSHYVRAKARKGAGSSVLAWRVVAVGLLVLIVVAVFFGITQGFKWVGQKLFSENQRFEIQHLVVSSDGRMTEDRIREYIEISEGTNLFAVSFDDIEKKLAGASAVESVRLRRELPHTLVVEIKERMPVARISGVNTTYPFLVDRLGYVLPSRRGAASLPLIKGLDTALRPGAQTGNPDVDMALKIIALCESTGNWHRYIQLEVIDVKYSDFIYMHLEGGTRVRMPRYSLRKKLGDLASLIQVGLSRGDRYQEIDMTVDAPIAPVVPF